MASRRMFTSPKLPQHLHGRPRLALDLAEDLHRLQGTREAVR